MFLKRQMIHRGNLILVNSRYSISNDMKIGKEELRWIDRSQILLERHAAKMLQELINKTEGTDEIVPVSGYRSMEEQTGIYESSLKENGSRFTKKYVAYPNHSEHQTGLAIDLAKKSNEIDFIRPDFPDKGACKLFRRYAPLYGFIERYEKSKEKITNISAEPWHFRYVGYPHSEIISKYGFSLEEYTDFIKQYSIDGKHYEWNNHSRKVEIFYVGIKNKEELELEIPDSKICQISGNNVDGVVVTVWEVE